MRTRLVSRRMSTRVGAMSMARGDPATWLKQAVGERRPAAAVRFGDLEARLLAVDPEDSRSTDPAARGLEMHSGRRFSVEEVLEVSALLRYAFDQADILGILPRTPQRNHVALMKEVLELYGRRLEGGRPPAKLASCMFSGQIFATLPAMLKGHSVSAITCRKLKPTLESEWGLEDVVVYQIPSQYETRDVDGAYEAAMHDISIWPDTHARLCSELTVREPGEVFLVGAGPFGKDLCVRIRELGGIGIDMGSVLDRAAGKVTRGPRRRVLDLHATGTPMEEIAVGLECRSRGRIDADTIAQEAAEAASDNLAAWRERPLDAGYPTIRLESLEVRVGGDPSPTACRIALGTTRTGGQDLLGIRWSVSGGDRSWLDLLRDLRGRGIRDPSLLMSSAATDDALANAAKAVFPRAAVRPAADPSEAFAAARQAVERHGAFLNERAATALIFVALNRAMKLPGQR